MFGPAATTREFSKKLLKWKAGVGGESKNARDLNAGGGSGELAGICWGGKGIREVKAVLLYVKIK